MNTSLNAHCMETVNAPDFDPEHVAALLAKIPASDPVLEGFDENAALAKLPLKTRKHAQFPRVAAGAAAILLMAAMISSAFGYGPVWLLQTMKDTVILHQNPGGNLTLPDNVVGKYHSLQDALDASGITQPLCPTWIPADYRFDSAEVFDSDEWQRIAAYYSSERGNICVQITISAGSDVIQKEEITEGGYIYPHDGRDFYILPNSKTAKGGWQNDTISLAISGQITQKEMEQILASIK